MKILDAIREQASDPKVKHVSLPSALVLALVDLAQRELPLLTDEERLVLQGLLQDDGVPFAEATTLSDRECDVALELEARCLVTVRDVGDPNLWEYNISPFGKSVLALNAEAP